MGKFYPRIDERGNFGGNDQKEEIRRKSRNTKNSNEIKNFCLSHRNAEILEKKKLLIFHYSHNFAKK